MVMTNYMDLLAQNQPWNLILFMVVPVVLEESVVAMVFGMVDPTLTGQYAAQYGRNAEIKRIQGKKRRCEKIIHSAFISLASAGFHRLVTRD